MSIDIFVLIVSKETIYEKEFHNLNQLFYLYILKKKKKVLSFY